MCHNINYKRPFEMTSCKWGNRIELKYSFNMKFHVIHVTNVSELRMRFSVVALNCFPIIQTSICSK